MEAIILAGGFGTRLQSVVKDVPKPMADVLNRPFLTYILDELVEYNFNKVILAVGYKKEVIIDYFGDNYKGMQILYSTEDEPLGTGGCIKKAMDLVSDDNVFIINGDTLFKVDYAKMKELNSIAIACKYMTNFDRYGEVIINNGIIERFMEKKQVEAGYINGGIYYLPKNVFSKYSLHKKFSLEKDFFEVYMDKLNIRAFLSNDYFIDIGIPEDYDKIQRDLSKKKALFLDRDGVINIDFGHVYKKEEFKFVPGIFDFCKNYIKKGYIIVIVTNQAGIAKGLYSKNDFLSLNSYMLDEFLKNGIKIANVYYCPHKPEDNCECRKPKPGLFLKAINDLNICPELSIAIGDKITDLEAAHAAGIKKLFLVPSRYELKDVDFTYEILDTLGDK